MSAFKYSLNTNCLFRKKTTEEIVNLCLASGLDGIEWGIRSLDSAKEEVQEMRQRTQDAGLEVVGYLNAGAMWNKEVMYRWSDALADGTPKTLRVEHPWFAWDYYESLHQPHNFLDLVKRAKDALYMLEELAKTYQLKYVLELHSGSISASPWAIYHLMHDIDPTHVGAIYDPANTVIEGFVRPRGACELLGAHLAYVHAKNLLLSPAAANPQPSEPRRMQWKFQGAFLDQGIIDYVEIFFALKNHGYHGWISQEELLTEDPQSEITANLSFLKACEGAAPAAPCPPFRSFD